MIIELALITALPEKEEELGQAILQGLEVIRQHPGCISANAMRCIEQPARYMLTVHWISLEAHIVDFRGGPLFKQWRGHLEGLIQEAPEVFHYQPY
ncbi:MAG: antibiotic biosynthesis monooxygenase [Ktedonobacteraceae bacterium]|nr:antibiotic biosynthesis monooxygenase [Ktedonobacteraceae bacterium]